MLAKEEVAMSGFGVMRMALEPLLLPILLVNGPAQNLQAALSLSCMLDLAEMELAAFGYGVVGTTYSPVAKHLVIPK
jgi:hypothetical protein